MPPADILRSLEDPVPDDEVHAWWADLDLSERVISQLAALLSEQEKNRARRLIHPLHRTYFTAARGLLRIILGSYLKIPPEKVCFEYTRQGKPYLADSSPSFGLCFNLSHSRGTALYGICKNRSIGVDIERIGPLSGMAAMVRRYFSEKEAAQIRAQPPNSQNKIFFQYWSMKEACLKARGDGLSGLHRIDLAADTRGITSETVVLDDSQKPWLVRPLFVDEKHAAAVALEGDASCRMVCRKWRP